MKIKEILSSNHIRELYRFLDILPDTVVVRLQYFATVGRLLNLRKPVRFTEKIQWYKLNYRIPLMTQCADKYDMRNYIKEKGFGEYLTDLYQVCDTYEQIDFSGLPNSFAIKCNNGSGTNIFVTNKENINIIDIEKKIKSWKQVNTLSIGREWAYKNIQQKIIVEELLVADVDPENGLNDYKILCFNHKAHYAWVDTNRDIDHRRNFYDLRWNQLNVVTDCPLTDEQILEPIGFNKMIEITESIAEDFPFVRVDFYSIKGKIYIGEITFYPWSGCVQFMPDEFDFIMGNLFKLPPRTIYK